MSITNWVIVGGAVAALLLTIPKIRHDLRKRRDMTPEEREDDDWRGW